jgi:hypothetical protein
VIAECELDVFSTRRGQWWAVVDEFRKMLGMF